MNRHRTPLPVVHHDDNDPLPSIGERVVAFLVIVWCVLMLAVLVLSMVG